MTVRIVLTILMLLAVRSPVIAQPALTAEQYKTLQNQLQRARNAEIAWRDAKKITLLQPALDSQQPTQEDSLDLDGLIEGQIGKLSYWDFKVANIVDDKNVILVLGFDRRIWLEGYPTDGLVDAQPVRIVDYVEVAGTKSYNTVAGSKATVRLVKLLPKEETAKRLAADIEKTKEAEKFRNWKSKNGNSVFGKFLSYRSSKVTIEQKDGKKLVFPISSLSTEDKDIAIKLSKEARQSPDSK